MMAVTDGTGVDIDAIETSEWLEALDAVVTHDGPPGRPDAHDGMTSTDVINPATARAARVECARRPAAPRSWPAAGRDTARSPTLTRT